MTFSLLGLFQLVVLRLHFDDDFVEFFDLVLQCFCDASLAIVLESKILLLFLHRLDLLVFLVHLFGQQQLLDLEAGYLVH